MRQHEINPLQSIDYVHNDLCLPRMWIRVGQPFFEIAVCKTSSPHHWKFIKAHTDNFITELCTQQTEVTLNHDDANVHNIGQGEAQR
jgi:hypothetical protein